MKEGDRLLYEVLKKHHIFEQEDLEAYIHAIIDIRASIVKINEFLLDVDDKIDKEEVKEIIWSVREEFRHIDYHLKDANLTE